jgi:hypothetical protein
VSAAQQAHRVRARVRQGRCYELAGKGQQRDPSWTLVHGTWYGGLGHAWLERDGIVYGVVLDREMPTVEYTNLVSSTGHFRYTVIEAAQHMSSLGHYGPWQTELRQTGYRPPARADE